MIERGEDSRLPLQASQSRGMVPKRARQDLIATSRPSRVSRARYTSPIPPAPSRSCSSNTPSRLPLEVEASGCDRSRANTRELEAREIRSVGSADPGATARRPATRVIATRRGEGGRALVCWTREHLVKQRLARRQRSVVTPRSSAVSSPRLPLRFQSPVGCAPQASTHAASGDRPKFVIHHEDHVVECRLPPVFQTRRSTMT